MPTKRHYVPTGTGNNTKLFQRNFNGSAGSCDDTSTDVFDREERRSAVFTPPGPVDPVNRLCWTTNVMTFNQTSVLGAANGLVPYYVPPGSGPFQNGFMRTGFPIPNAGATPTVHQLLRNGTTMISGGGEPMTTGNTVTYIGLPVIGFGVVSFTNGTLQVGTPPVTVLSNYGGNFAHKYNTTIESP
jgi:hypothetical protein